MTLPDLCIICLLYGYVGKRESKLLLHWKFIVEENKENMPNLWLAKVFMTSTLADEFCIVRTVILFRPLYNCSSLGISVRV